MAATTTDPIDNAAVSTAPRLAILPTWKDPDTGAVYVHRDLEIRQEAWAEEAHLPPIDTTERFGDVESWVTYVRRYAGMSPALLLTWNASGLHAILDYHSQASGDAGRLQWVAVAPFLLSPEWQAWMRLASGKAVAQREAIEKLEEMAPDILAPAPADLMALLRNLRATVNSTASTDLRPDGTTNVTFQQDQKVRSGAAGTVELPAEFTIGIRVLKGHVDDNGRPVIYKLPVRLRVAVDDQAHLAFRFAIPTAERTLEDVYADRVKAAKAQLGEGYTLLRAAD